MQRLRQCDHFRKTSVTMTTSRHVAAVTIKLAKRVYDAIVEHHKDCMKVLFLKHYEPLSDGNHDRLWVTRLPPSVKKQVRLHLTVLRNGDVFDWTDTEIGTKIIYTTVSSSIIHSIAKLKEQFISSHYLHDIKIFGLTKY